MDSYKNTVANRSGDVRQGASVTVYLAGTSDEATIYSDNNATSKDNPFDSDIDGFFEFWAEDGRYDIKATYEDDTEWRYGIIFQDHGKFKYSTDCAIDKGSPNSYEYTFFDDNDTPGSSAKWVKTGVNTPARASDTTWIYTDGYGYNGNGDQYKLIGYNILAIGALGDGSTNDTSIIQIAATNWTEVEFPDTGNSYMSNEITISANSRYYGNGTIESISRDTNTCVLKIADGSDNITIENLTLIYDSQYGDWDVGAIRCGVGSSLNSSTTNIKIKNCNITGSIWLSRIENSTVEGNTLAEGIIMFLGSYDYLSIINNTINNSGTTLFNGIGAYCLDATPVIRGLSKITGNIITTYRMGIEWRDRLTSVNNNTRSRISDNTITVLGSNSSSYGISLNSEGWTISNNTIGREVRADIGYGIEIPSCNNNIVEGNTVYNFEVGVFGIGQTSSTQSEKNSIISNRIYGCRVGIETARFINQAIISKNIIDVPIDYLTGTLCAISVFGEQDGFGTYTTINKDNIVSENSIYFDAGAETIVPSLIQISDPMNVKVSKNVIRFNSTANVTGIRIYSSDGCTIDGNSITNETYGTGYGIVLEKNSGRNIKVINNDGFELNRLLHYNAGITPYSFVENNNTPYNCANANTIFPSAYFASSSGGHKIAYAAASPTQGTWNAGDVILNTGSGAGWKCTVGGVSGTLSSVTANTTNTSTTVTPNTLTYLDVGQTITIAGVTGNKKITYINRVNGTFEIDVAADATVSGGSVAYVAPTFAALPF